MTLLCGRRNLAFVYCRGDLRFPRDMYAGDEFTTSRRIIRDLCEPNVLKRLGCQKRGVLDIKDAPFFEGVSTRV